MTHSPIALKKGDRIVIGCYDRPEPKPKDFIILGTDNHDHEGWKRYDQAHAKWQQSYKEYAVREADEDEVKSILFKSLKLKRDIALIIFPESLSSGIPCDELIPRLKLTTFCLNDSCVEYSTCNNCTKPMTMWTLKPLSVQSEEKWPSESEIKAIIERNTYKVNEYKLTYIDTAAKQILDYLKSKYTITRK